MYIVLSMRKIPQRYENPFDNVFYSLAENACPFFKDLNFTPNMITTIGNVFGLYSIYSLYHKRYVLAGMMFVARYFFDCLDGLYARKYNMVTDFGDKYDHYSDITITLTLLATLYHVNRKIFTTRVLLLFTFIAYTTLLFIFYQEQYYNKSEEGGTLSGIKKIIPEFLIAKTKEEYETNMQYIRWGGCGTFLLVIVGFVTWEGLPK